MINAPLLRVAAGLGALALALSACSPKPAAAPAASASPSAAAEKWQPKVGGCHSSFAQLTKSEAYGEADCATPHTYETFYLGEFKDAEDVPDTGSVAWREAWADCDTKASEYLGGPWRERLVLPGVSGPTVAAWKGGARWYSCEIHAMTPLLDGPNPVSASLKGAFNSLPELKNGCSDYAGTSRTPKVCTEPHNMEFVAFFASDLSYKELNDQLNSDGDRPVYQQCYRLIDAFAGGKNLRTGSWVWLPKESEWNAGDHNLRCFLYLSKVTVSKSLRGVGAGGWPIK